MKDALSSKDLRYIFHPCSQMKDYEENPPVRIVRGKGVYLYDAQGRRLIDAISSWWVNLFGHSNPRINRALQRQSAKLEHVIFSGFTHDPAVRYAEALVKAAPKGLAKVFFADNGSSAVEVALKLSYQYATQMGKRRPHFIALEGGYHGETLGALAVGGIPLYRKTYGPLLMRVSFAKAPTCQKCPFGKKPESCNAECFEFLEKRVDQDGPKNVAGIIVEPLVQCANGMNMYPPVYLKKLRTLCTRLGIHFIADEVAVGFGRTGKLFACEHAAVSPDLLCLSKGITGGYMPFAAVLMTQKIYNAFYGDYSRGKSFLHSHSYTGNPLACALALEVLKIFREEKILSKMKPAMAEMARGLKVLAGLPWVKNTRQSGLIGAFDLVGPGGKPFDPERRMGRRVALAAIRRGALLRPLGDTLYFMPPLVTTPAQLRQLTSITGEAIGQTLSS